MSRSRLTLAVSGGLGLLGALLVYVLSHVIQMPYSLFTRDPVEVLNGEPYVGVLSHVGLMFWAAAAAACFLGAALERSRFLLVFGLLSVLLALDDALLFHERVFPGVLGLSQTAVVVGYLVLFGGAALLFARRILETDYVLLALAVLLLGASTAMDQFLPFTDVETYVEDSFKFGGAVFWAAYFFNTTLTLARRSAGGSPSGNLPVEADRQVGSLEGDRLKR